MEEKNEEKAIRINLEIEQPWKKKKKKILIRINYLKYNSYRVLIAIEFGFKK